MSVAAIGYYNNRMIPEVHTCSKGSSESLVGGGSVAVTLKLHPNHVSCTLYCAWLSATAHGLGEDCSIFALEASSSHVSFSDLQVVVFAVLALFQFECVKGNLHLASFRDNKKPLPSETCRVVLDAVLWSAKLDCFFCRCIQVARFAVAGIYKGSEIDKNRYYFWVWEGRAEAGNRPEVKEQEVCAMGKTGRNKKSISQHYVIFCNKESTMRQEPANQ